MDLRDSPQDGPEQNADLGVGDKEHRAVIVLLDKVADHRPVLFDGRVLHGLGACSRSGSGGRSMRRAGSEASVQVARGWRFTDSGG